jgi:hypothetical protein
MPWYWLPPELMLHVADAVRERLDRAALCLAVPRLGISAQRELQAYKRGVLMNLAFHLVQGGAIDEALLRAYAARDDATVEGCDWITTVAAARGLAAVGYRRETFLGPPLDTYIWRLLPGGAMLRFLYSNGTVMHFVGKKDAERRVRSLFADGLVQHYEGEMRAERLVRAVEANGVEMHYEGEMDAERRVRIVHPDGVDHFEGEKGAERVVRSVFTDGLVQHYEGEKGAERLVRAMLPDGTVWHYEGEMDAERLVRTVYKDGGEEHYEGEMDGGMARAYGAS